MTDQMQAQYEAYPYPERDPAQEADRLITGSPSMPVEMDHWLWGGARDWSQPLRALVAGGGTGDGLIQLAQTLTSAGRPYEITYLDMSTAARRIAEERARARGLGEIRFLTGNLLDAGDHGPFDYIDCCGVLHHLPQPQAGFDALAGALAPGGGIGCMVYAPLGRSGVYPLQEVFATLFAGAAPAERLRRARAVFAAVPEGHPFKRNPHLGDHRQGDAGFYDLLLHSSDRPFTIAALLAALDRAELELAGVPAPALYDPGTLLPADEGVPEGMDTSERMSLAENLRGTFKSHVIYAVARGAVIPPPMSRQSAIPHLKDVAPARLAGAVARMGSVNMTANGHKVTIQLPKRAAPLISMADGRASLGAIAARAGLDPVAFGAVWGPVERALCSYGMMHYSTLLAE